MHDNDNPLFFGAGGVGLEDLYLLEIRQVAKASFQPILAVKKERAVWERCSASVIAGTKYNGEWLSKIIPEICLPDVEESVVQTGAVNHSGRGYAVNPMYWGLAEPGVRSLLVSHKL